MTTPTSSNVLQSRHKTPSTPNLCTPSKPMVDSTSVPSHGDGATNVGGGEWEPRVST